MKSGIKNPSMLSGDGSLDPPVIPAIFGNENPTIAFISRRTEVSLLGRPLLREVINRNSTDLQRIGQMQKGLESAVALFLAMKE